jgi:DNA-binding NarL/FixJ family response regulator
MAGDVDRSARIGALDRAHAAYARKAWAEVVEALLAADTERRLPGRDTELLALCFDLVGRDEEATDAWDRAYHAHLEDGDGPRAARCAIWAGLGLFDRGEMARGAGWLARARHLLEEGQEDCAEHGFILLPAAVQTLEQGDAAGALGLFDQAGKVGRRFGDPEVSLLALLGRGRSLVDLGELDEGVSCLDEALLGLTAGEASPIVVGIVYCAAIEVFRDVFDVGRAREWTAALGRWCDEQPDLVPFRGQYMLHRAEVLQLAGEWPAAVREIELACARLGGHPAEGEARYRQAELHRLRGDLSKAEAGYRLASEAGRTPHPGLSLLRLAQGRGDAADAAVRRELDEARSQPERCRVLPAFVEIMLARGDLAPARLGAEELVGAAFDMRSPCLAAASARASGSVLLAEGDPRAALSALREAASGWRALNAPYETARTRALLGVACRRVGDEDSARLEVDAARRVFVALGAEPDLASLDEGFAAVSSSARPDGLSLREVEVLALIATGKTNRAIAAELVISEKTVARHVSNIFAKLGLSSRAAATAYAYEHHLT